MTEQSRKQFNFRPSPEVEEAFDRRRHALGLGRGEAAEQAFDAWANNRQSVTSQQAPRTTPKGRVRCFDPISGKPIHG